MISSSLNFPPPRKRIAISTWLVLAFRCWSWKRQTKSSELTLAGRERFKHPISLHNNRVLLRAACWRRIKSSVTGGAQLNLPFHLNVTDGGWERFILPVQMDGGCRPCCLCLIRKGWLCQNMNNKTCVCDFCSSLYYWNTVGGGISVFSLFPVPSWAAFKVYEADKLYISLRHTNSSSPRFHLNLWRPSGLIFKRGNVSQMGHIL